jgi:dTDP-4-dehydrorhamnose reductase
MRVLVTGAGGQVGAAVAERLAARCHVIAHGRSTLDLADPGAIAARVREAKPALIVNAAAYTAVDRAETEREAAHAVNAIAPGVLAEEARKAGALLIHFSTDYVFDGTKPTPYVETDATHPLGVYGETKLAGERAVAQAGADYLILRTSWVYAPRGKNFLATMLRLAKAQGEVRVVDDQHGAPTTAQQLARATEALVSRGLDAARGAAGLYHATASGEVTWCGFAREIFARWEKLAPQAFTPPHVVAIPTRDYPAPARRPANSRLSNAKLAATFDLALGSWEAGLDEALAALASV